MGRTDDFGDMAVNFITLGLRGDFMTMLVCPSLKKVL